MGQDKKADRIREQLRAFSVGSYIFQSRIAADMNLHPTDLQAIYWLGRNGPATAGELGAATGLTSGATTALLDRLARLGFVERRRDERDRRKVRASLRSDGAIAELRSRYTTIDRRLSRALAKCSSSELETLTAFLDDILVEPDSS